MAGNRAFKNLASLRTHFDEPLNEDRAPMAASPDPSSTDPNRTQQASTSPMLVRSHDPQQHPVSPITGKVDGRRLRKVLKTPSVSLSVAVRSELHEDVSTMLFARKSTWIALLDQLLGDYVADAKSRGQFPK